MKRHDGRRFASPARAEREYLIALRALAGRIGGLSQEMGDDLPGLEAALLGYADAIQPWANAVAEKMWTRIDKLNAAGWARLGREISKNLREEIASAPTGAAFLEFMRNQVHLITSLPREAGERVHAAALEGLMGGTRSENIASAVMELGDVSMSRAKCIARTEVARTASALTMVRAEHIGATHYYWRTSGDTDVRKSHREMNGKIISFNEMPTLSDGTTTHAGQIYNCRCYIDPILSDTLAKTSEAPSEKNMEIISSATVKAGKEERVEAPSEKNMEIISSATVKADKADNSRKKRTIRDNLDEIKRLGRNRLKMLLAEKLPGFNVTLAKALALEDYEDVAKALKILVQEKLREVREVGTEAIQTTESSGIGVDLMRRVAGVFPADWVKAGNKQPVKVIITNARGCYFSGEIETDTSSTAEHEYTHHLQKMIPELDMLFQLEHLIRTENEPVVRLNSGDGNEYGKKDGYSEEYQGRQYPFLRAEKCALEVIAMAMQPMLGSDDASTKLLEKMLMVDIKMVELTLGALFHFKP